MKVVSKDVDIMPGNEGRDCLGNGETLDENGDLIECCCDECDYLMCCYYKNVDCLSCDIDECPRKSIMN